MALAGSTRRLVLWLAFGGFLAGTALTVWGFVIEPDRLVITQRDLRLAKWPEALPPLKVIAVSDIHTGAGLAVRLPPITDHFNIDIHFLHFTVACL